MLLKSSPLQPMADRLSAHGDLNDDDRQAILDLPYRMKHLERLAHVVHERETIVQCCVIVTGFAIRYKIVGAGARQIVAMHTAGDMVDLQNAFLTVADHSVQMLTDSEVAFIPREDVKKLAFDRPAVGSAMWLETLVDASIAREWIANVGRRDARTRLAHLLCEFSVKFQAAGIATEDGFALPMTQDQLADTVGLTPVHVNRSLRGLEAENLITRNRSTRMVSILDWAKLVSAGDFDDTYLHLRGRESAFARSGRAA